MTIFTLNDHGRLSLTCRSLKTRSCGSKDHESKLLFFFPAQVAKKRGGNKTIYMRHLARREKNDERAIFRGGKNDRTRQLQWREKMNSILSLAEDAFCGSKEITKVNSYFCSLVIVDYYRTGNRKSRPRGAILRDGKNA